MVERPQSSHEPRSRAAQSHPDPSVSGSSIELTVSDNHEVGRILRSRYELTRVIGEGGMGVVYEAFDRQVQRKVAIKLIRAECLGDRKFLTRFKRELEVTTRLRHPSTIRVFEHGEDDDGRPYMVMELLTGESLAERMERGRIDEIEALQLARQVAESLSEAHDNGIFHRDLKPDNIFIETVGITKVVKVLDFGIAGGIDASRLTKAGEVFGTPQYMSPEQCNGLPLDHRTDIYSLGCILYEMIEGRPPFAAESPMATMLKHVKSKPPAPKHSCKETARVLAMALRKDRTKRVQSCARFSELLGECIGASRAAKEGRIHQVDPNRLATAPVPAVQATPPSGVPPVGPRTITGNLGFAQEANASSNLWMYIAGGVGLLAVVAVVVMMAIPKAPVTPAPASDLAAPAAPAKLPRNRAYISTNEPGAKVLLDGEEQCETPCTVEVPVGDNKAHELRLHKDGFIEVVQTWQPASVTEAPPEFPDLKPSTSTVRVGVP